MCYSAVYFHEQRYLLNLAGGVLGPDCEAKMLESLSLANEAARFEILRRQLSALPMARKRLLALMFGTWHLMVLHALKPKLIESLLPDSGGGGGSEDTTSGVESQSVSTSGESGGSNSNSKSVAVVVESVSKAVCGSVFHTCREDPALVENAVRVMQPLTLHFSSGKLYEASLVDFFCSTVGIDVPPLSERVLGLGCPPGSNACGPASGSGSSHLAPPTSASHNACAHNSSPSALCSSCMLTHISLDESRGPSDSVASLSVSASVSVSSFPTCVQRASLVQCSDSVS